MNVNRSAHLFEEAQKYLPGGVDSPVRAFKAVGGDPLFIKRAKGSKIYDEDGNEYIDYVCSWGPMILGHASLNVIKSIQRMAESGTSFGAPTELETTLAKMVCEAVPSIEMVRFVSSGTEATMSALRLARAFTEREKIIKFAGCYHGHSDGLLAKAGSGATTLGIPDSPGVPVGYAQNTLIAQYNDLESVRDIFTRHNDIAAAIIEPVAANMGVVLPEPGFLEGLREVTRSSGALLIFDEVISGFRLAYRGAQEIYGITPDLTCLGKIIGGGLPVGAYGGRTEIMEMMAPVGPVYQAGTLSGNPLAMAAGIETLRALQEPDFYKELERKAAMLWKGITESAAKAGVPLQVSRIGSIMTPFFTSEPVRDYGSATRVDTQKFGGFHRKLLEQGVYWPPSQYEAVFVSQAHSEEDIETTVKAISEAIAG
ncbi:MAG: glutamate-1-semialdehyde 2,1-aminomutase [Chloroflexi bacterium]|nr:glutamate-1-semialdehyde 2,1-aminomutase [Chloroflexota bacterium]